MLSGADNIVLAMDVDKRPVKRRTSGYARLGSRCEYEPGPDYTHPDLRGYRFASSLGA
jgi:hypothetical protein